MLLRFPAAEVNVEVVRAPAALAQGLSGRAFLPDDEGMLFDLGRMMQPQFHMRGVRFPLDMIFLDESQEVVGIVESAPPNGAGPYSAWEPARYVVEVNGGWAARHGVELGDGVRFG